MGLLQNSQLPVNVIISLTVSIFIWSAAVAFLSASTASDVTDLLSEGLLSLLYCRREKYKLNLHAHHLKMGPRLDGINCFVVQHHEINKKNISIRRYTQH